MRCLPFLLLLAGCGFAGAEQSGEDDRAAAIPSARAIRVEVVSLERSPAVVDLSLPGEVEASHDAMLTGGVGGYVEAVHVEPGDQVRRGQPLMRVDTTYLGAQLEIATAEQERAAAALERVRQLGDLATDSQILDAETNARIAEARRVQADTRYQGSLVRSPFDGIVADVAVEPGESAGPGQIVARVVQLDPAHVTLSVADRDVVALVPGTPVTVSSAARSDRFEGLIKHVAPAADLRTRAFPVEVEVANPDGRLLPGMIARVRVERSLEDDVLVIPQDWLVTRRDERGVFVEEDGYAVWRPVELGDVVHDDVVVTGGLQPDERVVINGHRELVPGDPLLVARAGTCCSAGRPVFGD